MKRLLSFADTYLITWSGRIMRDDISYKTSSLIGWYLLDHMIWENKTLSIKRWYEPLSIERIHKTLSNERGRFIWNVISHLISWYLAHMIWEKWNIMYRQASNISRTVAGNGIVDISDVGAAATTSTFSTSHLPSMDWANTTARRGAKHSSFGIWCAL